MRITMLLHRSVVHDARVRREARTLAEAGHDVTVLELTAIADGDWTLDGFARRSASPPGWVRRRLPLATYRAVFLACFAARGVRTRPEVVHAHDAAMLLPGVLVARITGARLVYDSHELATGVPYRSGGWAGFVAVLERVVVPRCAAVITVSDGIAGRLRERYGLRAQPVVLRNVCDLPVGGCPGAPGLRERLGIGAEALVLHHGSAAEGRGAEVLVAAVAGLPAAHLVFLGAGDEREETQIAAAARAHGAIERVHVLPSAPLDELLASTAEADVGVSLLQDTCENHRLALPNKVFEYVRAGVPVVAGDLPELRRLFDEHQIGWTVASHDPDLVRGALGQALAHGRDPALRERLAAAAAELSWERERSGLLALYEALAGVQARRVRAGYAAYGRDARKARAWAAGNPGNRRLRRELLAHVLGATAEQRAAGRPVLDIGCGGGFWLARLAEHGVAAECLHGVDLIAERVAAARRSVPGATVGEGDGSRLPYEDGRFGVVLLLTVLSSAGDRPARARVLGEAARVLAPGGVLLVYEPRLPNLRNTRTRHVARSELDGLGLAPEHRSLTLLPALARRLRRADTHDALARLEPLRTHRLSVLRAPG